MQQLSRMQLLTRNKTMNTLHGYLNLITPLGIKKPLIATSSTILRSMGPGIGNVYLRDSLTQALT